MKLTKQKLKKIIKEEISKVLKEGIGIAEPGFEDPAGPTPEDVVGEVASYWNPVIGDLSLGEEEWTAVLNHLVDSGMGIKLKRAPDKEKIEVINQILNGVVP